MDLIRIGTRGSKLALAQAGWVRERLREKYPALEVFTVIIKTAGDRFLDTPVQSIGGKGIFVKEIEDALLKNEIDLAIHSMKDLPTEFPAGLMIAAVPEREDTRDALVSRDGRALKELMPGARVGTGSLRRRAQVLNFRRDLTVVPIRGNIDTRLRKLERGEVDALVMAVAGLSRVGSAGRITEHLAPEVCLSAVGQGAVGVEAREKGELREAVAFLDHPPTAVEVRAERAFLRRLGGGCQIPVGARGWVEGEKMRMMGCVGDPEGRRVLRAEIEGEARDGEKLGTELADRLIRDGAGDILGSKEGFGAYGSR